MKQKKCKGCGNKFTPYNTLQKACSPRCALDIVEAEKQKAFKRETKERKEKLKTRSDWMREVQLIANKYARIRDSKEGCISCDKSSDWGGQWHGSHYRPAGNCSSLRFHPLNINKACSECNNHKSGNLIEYRIGLINKIGIENVEWLESQNRAYKWDIFDLKEIKEYYKEQIKLLEKNND